MPVDNLQEFEAGLDDEVRDMERGLVRAMKTAAHVGQVVLIATTPKRTGRAAAAWDTGSSLRPGGSIGPLSALKPYGVAHVFNPLFYVRFLNDGTDKMRGRHMVERVIPRMVDVLEAEL